MVRKNLTAEAVCQLKDAYLAMSIEQLFFSKPAPKELFIRSVSSKTSYILSIARSENRQIVGLSSQRLLKKKPKLLA